MRGTNEAHEQTQQLFISSPFVKVINLKIKNKKILRVERICEQ